MNVASEQRCRHSPATVRLNTGSRRLGCNCALSGLSKDQIYIVMCLINHTADLAEFILGNDNLDIFLSYLA